jgi:NAD(P)-dependent dehydrogenase (short-subunit alcohol dehydrogenase family)
MKLENKISVITGAGRGIGRSIAMAFAKEGSRLILIARSKDQLDKVAEEVRDMGQIVLAVPCDVSRPQDVESLAKAVRDEFGHVDILVNNAGISKRSAFLEYDDETWLEVIRVNLFSAYLCSKAILPMIQQQKNGRIINMASTAAKNPVPFNTAYSASKHGLLGLTKSLASELALTGYPGITVNAVCPFFVNTEMFQGPQGYVAQMMKITGKTEKDAIEKAALRNLQQRVLDPDEIAAMVVYLASEDARGITGQAINVCGGSAFH